MDDGIITPDEQAKRADRLLSAIAVCRERGIVLPTFAQLIDPRSLVPADVQSALVDIDVNDLHPLNLFRITWRNREDFGGDKESAKAERGCAYAQRVHQLELPRELTNIKSPIRIIIGKHFPTGAHKVGATYGPLVSRLVTGAFDPRTQKALWPSTGNYCRGGAFNSALLGCKAVAVLPERMSAERFRWLESLGSEIVRTPGCESNVREIFEASKALHAADPEGVVVLNQFAEFANPLFHYHVTGRALMEVFNDWKTDRLTANPHVNESSLHLAGISLSQGSAGTINAASYLKDHIPTVKVGALEALQCPTLLNNGYGDHTIEGIGDKHVPWIFNIRDVDAVMAIDDEDCMRAMRLFNEPEGRDYLRNVRGVPAEVVGVLGSLGISSICNILGSIQLSRYFEFGEDELVVTVSTDSMDLYQSRLEELRERHGSYTSLQAALDYAIVFEGKRNVCAGNLLELSYMDKRRIHNLKYFTWVEQQGKTVEELNAQWSDRDYWHSKWRHVDRLDELIKEFNEKVKSGK